MSKTQRKKGNKKEKEKERKERVLRVPRKLKALWDKSVL